MSATVGARSQPAAPDTQSRSGTRSVTATAWPSSQCSNTGAAIAYAAHALPTSGTAGTLLVRCGSMPYQHSWRIDAHPELRLPRYGDPAETAIISGPSAVIQANRSAHPAAGPASRLICRAAVELIIDVPADP